MMKKLSLFLLTVLLGAGILGGAAFASAEDGSSTALFVQSVTLAQENEAYTISYRFDKQPAEAESDITEASAAMVTVNDTLLSEIEGGTLAYVSDGEGGFLLQAAVPASAGIVAADGSDHVELAAGLVSPTGYRTTVRYMHDFSGGLGAASRVYRSDDMDDYESVTVTGLSVPEMQGMNVTFYVYLSDSVVSKKMIDLQVRDLSSLKLYHGEKGDGQYSDAELDLLYQYEIIDADWADSLLYKTLFGCESYNGLEAYPGNNSGSAPDMTPQSQVSGIDLYTLYQVQEQTADSSHQYVDQNGETQWNGGSLQPLVVQMHMENNAIQIVLKGDSGRDNDATAILNYDGSDTGMTTFNENIAPSTLETMAFGLKAGFLFPNGKMLKEDVTFIYDPSAKVWREAGEEAMETLPDETLDNQEGYTEEELALIEQGSGSGGVSCMSQMSGSGLAVSFILTLAAAAAAALKARRA